MLGVRQIHAGRQLDVQLAGWIELYVQAEEREERTCPPRERSALMK